MTLINSWFFLFFLHKLKFNIFVKESNLGAKFVHLYNNKHPPTVDATF